VKPVQYFSDEYLEQTRNATHEQILNYLEQFRLMQARSINKTPAKSKLISMKVPEDLLSTFKAKCETENLKYQTQIKVLMKQWLS